MSEVTDFNNNIDWSKYAGTGAATPATASAYTTPDAAVSTTPTASPLSGATAGILGVLGSSAGTFASSYLDSLGKKLAGVNTTATPAAATATDTANSAAAAGTAANQSVFTNYQPLLIVGIVAVLGLGLVAALRR